MGIRVIQGSLHSRWTKFAKQLRALFPDTTVVTTYTSSNTSLHLCPVELVPSGARPHSMILYLSGSYQLQDELSYSHLESLGVCFLVPTKALQNELAEKSCTIPVHVIPLNVNDESWDLVAHGKIDSLSSTPPAPRRPGKKPKRKSSTSVISPVRPSKPVAMRKPTISNPPLDQSLTSALAGLMPTSLKDIVYCVNAEYQLDHLVSLLGIMPGDVLFPKLSSEFTTARSQLDQMSSFSGNRVPCSSRDEFIKKMRGKFLISTGIFRGVAASNYPHSLFTSHGISDKKFYHRQAARARFALYASSGPYFTEMYKSHGVPDERIIKCGYLRTEAEIQEYPTFDVLFAPTHRTFALTDYCKSIIEACERLGLSLIIRPHPLTKPAEYNPVAEIVDPYLCDTDITTWTLLRQCKSVITDVSSISFEALLLGKPVSMVKGRLSWSDPSKHKSGQFGTIVTSTKSSGMASAVSAMLDGDCKSRVPVSEVFYTEKSPSAVVKKAVKRYIERVATPFQTSVPRVGTHQISKPVTASKPRKGRRIKARKDKLVSLDAKQTGEVEAIPDTASELVSRLMAAGGNEFKVRVLS